MKLCPKCKTENPIAANYCRHCRYEFSLETKNGQSLSPFIHSFSVKEPQYVIGSHIHIAWNVQNYKSIILNGEDVSLITETEFEVSRSIELVLHVENDYDHVERRLQIVPTAIPVINKLNASHCNVLPGEKVKVSWDVEHTQQLFLVNSDISIDVTGKSSIEIIPDKSDTYTLECVSIDEKIKVQKSIAIHVFEKVKINNFSSDKRSILESIAVNLFWNVEHSDKIVLLPNGIDVTNKSSIQLFPSRTTEYRLVASNTLSTDEQILSIGVKQLPKVDVKLSESLAYLQIPECNIALSPILDSIKETSIDRWISCSPTRAVTQEIWNRSLLKDVKALFKKLK